ncbi:helix-turn-helix domain-containing protein (plasmid) [Clostridium botulinum]|uniref:Viral A-type inclusion protein repeat containing protein n=1 Tax=Clostridium botulinum (strain 657 / Type Ba4) TaxID=515621 RepID=A0A3F2ZX80_CLOB6|nr:helix-turn-helix domain-containing protein [Clostridium botulinum]ACQ51176.1 putative viral A-type inclusion protein repeat containing protein [Clostridium botulinum Ba4 str. 657]AJE13419.1 HTH domain protein [Clostridium botulinum CDC_1436]AXG90420.1 helix-turn-helix domain-containing protein [Clostridium botulinum]MBD5631092.1 helix-turn-helix domain-containing protein [Clostridium botulinum]MBO0524997.1 helix-turn-helix domain-containing protein [Clostridium botulinum]
MDYKLKFTSIDNAIIYSKKLKATHKIVYLVIASFSNKSNECYPSLDTIADRADVSKTTVIDAIKNLEALGLMTKQIRKSNEKMLVANKSKQYTIYKNQTNIYKILETPEEMIDKDDPQQIYKVRKYEPTIEQREIQELSVYMIDKNFKINYFTKELFFDELLEREKFPLEDIKKAIDKAFDRNISSPNYVASILYNHRKRKKDKEIRENNKLEVYKNIKPEQKKILDEIDANIGLENIPQSYIKGYLKLATKHNYEQIRDALDIAKNKNIWTPSYVTGIIKNKNEWDKDKPNKYYANKNSFKYNNKQSQFESINRQAKEMSEHIRKMREQKMIQEFIEDTLIDPNDYENDFERHKAQELAWLNKYNTELTDEEKEKQATRVAIIRQKEGVPFYVQT